MPKLWPKHAEVMQESFGSKVGVKWDSLGVKLTNWGVWEKGKTRDIGIGLKV